MKNLINLNNGDRLNLRVQGQILLSESVKTAKLGRRKRSLRARARRKKPA